MGKLGGFLKFRRVEQPERDPLERVGDYREFMGTVELPVLQEQGARCMECGVPFCHSGCPLGNLIPEWNDLVYRDRWAEAIEQLHRTNNFPEFTGRLCPAPCEAACVLEIEEGNAVTIKQIEVAIVNRAWEEGWVVPQPARTSSGRSVGVVGAGPAGLACAQQLARAGHAVTLYERDEAAGGLVRFGVPDFKIEKWLVERRVQQLEAEGVVFRYGVDVGLDVSAEELRERHDAVVLAVGARVPRDLPVPGRELDGVHFAMEYLYQRNRWVARELGPQVVGAPPAPVNVITAAGKHVIVVGGGDTGADCVGNAHREGAASVTQIELVGEPPERRPDDLTPWPSWPMKLRTSYALKEGGERDFAVSTTVLSGSNGRVERIHWTENSGAPPFDLIPGTEEERPADLVLLAMGFLGPEPRVLEAFGVEADATRERAGAGLRDERGRRLRRRRCPPRPVPDRLGDRRRPPVRDCRRPLVGGQGGSCQDARGMSHLSASFSATLRVRLDDRPGAFAELARVIAETGASLGAIDLVRAEAGVTVRDVTVLARDADHIQEVAAAAAQLESVEVEHVSDRTFLLHLGGKIEVTLKAPLVSRDDLSMAYTPGVARVSQAIADDPEKAWSLTIKRNTVAIVSDGTAVLGLGDIGPEAALPVMEGKAMLLKEFAGVDGWPVCLATTDTDEIVAAVTAIAPVYGAINLEDISAPRCFEIEERLRATLDIPVFHDDQHGTAIVVYAAFVNALRVVGKRPQDVKVVITGVGAAGVAVTRILRHAGVGTIVGCDRQGAVYSGRRGPRGDQGRLRGGDEPGPGERLGGRGAQRRRRVHRPLAARGGVRRRHPLDGEGRDRLRDGQPDAGGGARGA